MKGKSLFKKIGAIATTAAMLASVGVTGFATDPKPAGDNDNKGIIVNAPTVTEWDVTNNVAATTTTGVYKVEVSYGTDTDVINGIGVTMLAYGGEGRLTESDISTGYTSSMKIVGVDQINTADVPDITTGTFTFYVDTNEDSTNAQIKMAKGQTGIVLLSGDGADGANGVLFRAGNVNAVVALAAGGSLDENNAYDAGEVARPSDSAAEIAAVKSIVTTKLVLSDGANIELTDADLTVTPVTGKAYDSEDWQEQNCEYTVAVSKSGYDVTNNNFTVKVTYAANTWNYSGTTATVEAVSFPKVNVTGTDVDAAVKTALVGKKVTLDTNEPYTIAEGDIADGKMTITKKSGEYDGALLQNQNLTYTLTIPAGAWGRYVLASQVTADVSVTVTAEDNRTVIGGAKLADGATTLTIANADAPANKTELDTKVAQLIAAKGVVVVKKDEASTTAATTAYSVASEGSYTAKPTDTDVTLTYTVTVTATDLSSEWKFETGTSVTFDIDVTVQKAAPAYACGDVNHDKAIDTADAIAILDYAVNPTANQYVYDNMSESDARKDNSIDTGDAIAILDSIVGSVTLPVIP